MKTFWIHYISMFLVKEVSLTIPFMPLEVWWGVCSQRKILQCLLDRRLVGTQSLSRCFNEKKHFLPHWKLDRNSSAVQLIDIAICSDRFYLQYMNIKCIKILKTAKSTFGKWHSIQQSALPSVYSAILSWHFVRGILGPTKIRGCIKLWFLI